MTSSQQIILALLGFLFCLLLSAIIGFVYFQRNLLPDYIPTLPIPDSILPSNTYEAAQTSNSTFTLAATASDTPEPTFTPTQTVTKLPDTTENIHVALIFNSKVYNPNDEIGAVDLVWGSKYPTEPRGVYNLYYYPFDRDADGGTGGSHHDITWFLANHPDWIEYTCDRITPAYEYGDPNVPLDITNPEVIDYMLNTYILPAIEAGYQGIAFDNVVFDNNGLRCGVWRDGEWVEQPTFTDNVHAWAASMYARLHELNVTVAMNSPYDFERPEESDRLYRYLDIVVDERGFTNWGLTKENYISGGAWLANMQALQALDANGKGFVSINQMPEDFDMVSQEEKQWALANYLLVKGKYSWIAITGFQEYGRIFLTPEYSVAIGHAPSVMYKSQNVYMRDFSNGLVIVNPSYSQSFKITLIPHIYQDLYGNNVDTIKLEPRSGIVLLRRGILIYFTPANISLVSNLLQAILFPLYDFGSLIRILM